MTGSCSVFGCNQPILAKGYCEKHYWRNHRHGSPFARPSTDGAPLDWLGYHADWTDDDCLIWPFGKMRGYGSVLFHGKIIGAHRAMCTIAHGDPPAPNLHAAHSCGQGRNGCVNPRHLRWATAKENMLDAVEHRRSGLRSHAGVKLSEEQVRDIVALRATTSGAELARRFGVSESLISRIVHGSRRGLAKSTRAA